jgi:methylated-DNA-protein-cysteine methyltransferase related protein
MPKKSLVPSQLERALLRTSLTPNQQRDAAFRRAILSIPAGRVASYGQVAAAAGYPLYHRAVAKLLRSEPDGRLPWHRVLGSGGVIKLRYDAAMEQRLRLQMEGVRFQGKRVVLAEHQHEFRLWTEPDDSFD